MNFIKENPFNYIGQFNNNRDYLEDKYKVEVKYEFGNTEMCKLRRS